MKPGTRDLITRAARSTNGRFPGRKFIRRLYRHDDIALALLQPTKSLYIKLEP